MPSRVGILTRPLQLLDRVLQWCSAVIVLGITSYFVNVGPRHEHVVYQEVIAAISVVFFLPAFLSPFLPKALSGLVLAIDVIFSYLWLTSFIFAAQDYNWKNCRAHSPPGMGCSRKHANMAFIFLAFIFTFFGMFLEVLALWSATKGNPSEVREKNGHAASSTTAAHRHPGEETVTANGAGTV